MKSKTSFLRRKEYPSIHILDIVEVGYRDEGVPYGELILKVGQRG
jgi:hypothetical protein